MAEGKLPDLTTGARRLVEAAVAKRDAAKHSYLGINHWLLALYERHGPMVDALLGGTDIDGMKQSLAVHLERGELGPALDETVAAAKAGEVAQQRGKLQAAERDLATAVLQAAGYAITPTVEFGHPESGGAAAGKSKTPMLDQFGRDLTRAAQEGKLSPMIGREEEAQLMMETLCRNTKRNPVLIGPAGVGKTAIVEGLANLVIAGKVPEPLKGVRIISLQPSVLVAGADTRGDLEKRMQGILQEAAQNQVILFIDEIHTIIGAGGMVGTNDIGALLKPALARGEIAVISATTDDEYRRFIESDTALERRFQPIRVNELSLEQTFLVLTALRAQLGQKFHVQVDDSVLEWLIQFGQQYMKNRQFPDKAVDLLEQSVAHAVAKGLPALSLEAAQDVAQRMVGMPLSLETRLDGLQKALAEQGMMRPEEIQGLLNRLQVTMRGLDLRACRPNAVLLLSGSAAESSETLASTIAGALFGDPGRTVTIDLSRMVHPEDVSLLVGAPPGYVGYSDTLPLHRLAQIPWCVVRFENVEQCHPSIRAVIAQAMVDGRLTDGRGRPIYFSDAVVMLTAQITLQFQHPLGFHLGAEPGIAAGDVLQAVAQSIGEELAAQVDLFLPGFQPVEVSEDWLENHMLADLAERFLKQGLRLEWDASLTNWLAEARSQVMSERDWERWIDYSLSPLIVAHLPKPGGPRLVAVKVKIDQEELKVEAL
jgi:ATP-dependent Clp protease ATP-binding subunit ClpC